MNKIFKKIFSLQLLIFILLLTCSCHKAKIHEHIYVEGKCICGEKDPSYVPHVHEYVNGVCSCGAKDPSYVPHVHEYANGVCDCGAKDPSYVPHVHEYANGVCGCGEKDPNHKHEYIKGYCLCGKKHPDFGNCALDRENEACLDPTTWNWDYNKDNWDGKGMKIEIMVFPVSEYDPGNAKYKGERKQEKQALIAKVEAEYNIDIVYKDYPYNAPWGPERIKWITNGVTKNLDVGDIFLIDASWVYSLKDEAIAELYDLNTKEGIFTEYNYIQNEKYNLMASVNNKVYAYSKDDLIPDFWLHYNQALIDQYNLPDPAKMWNNNEWTWSAFLDLLATAQTAFDNDSSGKKKWAFGGDYFTNAKGFVAARGGELVKDGKVLLDDEVVVEVYEDLQDIEDLYWEPNGSTVSTTNFREGLVLFQTGAMWFYGAAERWPSTLDFGISAVPYPRMDDDPELKNYQIPVGYENMYAVRKIKEDEVGLTSSILFNILDDLANGLKPEVTAVPNFKPIKSLKKYDSYLEARIENQESIKAIMDIVFNHQDLIYLEMIDLLSMLVSQGGCSENGIYLKSYQIIERAKIKPKERLGQLKPIYQLKLNEILGTKEE